MRFKNCTVHTKITHAIKSAEMLLTPISPMIEELKLKNDFEFNSGTGEMVAKDLLLMQAPINVYTYKPWNPWTAAMGYFDGSAIHINARKLDLFSHNDLVGLLLHEFSHYVGFQHGNNYKTEYKCKHSVPYYISENINRWV